MTLPDDASNGEDCSGSDFAEALNDEFYHSSPADYFSQRLHSLVDIASGSETFGPELREGVSLGDIVIQGRDNASDSSVLTGESLDRYVVVEAEVLLYHLSETLLRLFLVHLAHPPCPWIAVTGPLEAREFRRRLRHLFIGHEVRPEALEDAVSEVVLGHSSPPSTRSGFTEDEWKQGKKHLTQFMRLYTEHVLTQVNLYNGSKHGFGVKPSKAVFGFLDDAGRPLFGQKGPSIAFLEREKKEAGVWVWKNTTVWLDVIHVFALTWVGIEILSCMWTVAKYRYTGKLDEGQKLFVPFDLSPTTLRMARPARAIDRFSRTVGVERKGA